MTGIFWCRLRAGREDTGNNVVGLLISCVTILYLQSPALVLSRSFFYFGVCLWPEQIEHFHTKMHLIDTKEMVT